MLQQPRHWHLERHWNSRQIGVHGDQRSRFQQANASCKSVTPLPCFSIGAPLVVAVFVVMACSKTPSPDDFRVGATREQVLDSFGVPARQQSFLKTGEAIWGPIEDFWSRVPMNSTVEVWTYQVKGGSVELYFIDESVRVQGTGFAPEGAVFEGSS